MKKNICSNFFKNQNTLTLPCLNLNLNSTIFFNYFSVDNNRFLEGKTAIVTGSTSGIGLAIATEFAKRGCSIMLNGFGGEKEITKIQNELKSISGADVAYHSADMTKKIEVKDLIDSTVNQFGNLSILVNNAGIQHVSSVEEFPEEAWDKILAVNLTAVFLCTKYALPHMQKSKWGRIINVSSVHGLVASKDKAAYVASKHGVMGLTKTTALETAGSGITCNSINPGWVLTPLVQQQIDTRAKQNKITIEEASKDLLSEKQPSKQFVTANQIGEIASFICSDAASQMTGTPFVADGGWTAV